VSSSHNTNPSSQAPFTANTASRPRRRRRSNTGPEHQVLPRPTIPATLNAEDLNFGNTPSPTSSAYWVDSDLDHLNRCCYEAAVQFPNVLTRHSVERYLEVAAWTETENKQVHLALLLLRIEYHTWKHANDIHCTFLRQTSPLSRRDSQIV
jgi:hypothetical protein